MHAIARTEIPEARLLGRGKVRDLYEIDEAHLLLVATDRLSAFDVVLPDALPGKGIILTQLSLFWFRALEGLVRHHVVGSEIADLPRALQRHADVLRGRSLLVRRAEVFPVECIVRGYLLGSGWKDYRRDGAVCGIALPPGLQRNHRFEAPLFTPSTKAATGHDENVPFAEVGRTLGEETAARLRDLSLAVYERGARRAEEAGLIICDTKMEWGRDAEGVLLVDEVLTPDSSRYWLAEEAAPALAAGRSPASWDKQIVRDHLERVAWDKTPPGPELPAEVIEQALSRYRETYERLTGRSVPHL